MPIEKTYKIDTDASGLHIALRPNRSWAIKFGLTVYTLVYIGAGIMLLSLFSVADLSFRMLPGLLVPLLAVLAFVALYFLIAKSFISKLTENEEIAIDDKHLTISLRSLFGVKKKVFNLSQVKEIGVAGDENFTQHPLEDNNAAIGFMVNERLIRYQITDGNMYISDGKEQVRFGKEIPSWDAEEIVEKIEQYTGRTFSVKPTGPEEEYWR
ncbi:MAG: hypothetical protein JST90_12995 [Bacteroidetes bacterium]|nr:hypothetical protein [Bacteroidota bacterium]